MHTADLNAVVNMVDACTRPKVRIRFQCMIGHLQITGNKAIDEMAKAECLGGDLLTVSFCGVHAICMALHAQNRMVVGFEISTRIKWSWQSVHRYVPRTTNKGDLYMWKIWLGSGGG